MESAKYFVAFAVAIYDYKEVKVKVKVTAQLAVFIRGVNEELL